MFDHKTDYMPAIIEATKDLDIAIVFNNAGYIVTGFFDQTTIGTRNRSKMHSLFILFCEYIKDAIIFLISEAI